MLIASLLVGTLATIVAGHSDGSACSHAYHDSTPDGYVRFPQEYPQPVFYKHGQGGYEAGAPLRGDHLRAGFAESSAESGAEALFAGIQTFAQLPFRECLKTDESFDIAILGMPYDVGTSYRPGARFGPSGIRRGSRRVPLAGGYNRNLNVNPFRSWARILDCGDVPVTPYDSEFALRQMEEGHKRLLHSKAHSTAHQIARDTITGEETIIEAESIARDGKVHPRVLSLGGDHTIVLPILRSLNSAYGPISVIHFDSHLDTWDPKSFGGLPDSAGSINHGTYFWHAAQQGLIAPNGTSIHAGIRTTLSGPEDYDVDAECGFHIVEAVEIDEIGTQGIIDRIKATVGDRPVYLSIDIDTLDPSAAPATGTPETGGWSTRELRRIVRGLKDLTIVGADIVEVAPAYDTQAEQTALAASDLLFDIMSMFVLQGPLIKA